jgi:HlyD family secretion protein
MKRVLWIVVGLVVAALVAFGGWKLAAQADKVEIDYKTAKVQKQKLVAQVTASGTLSARVTVQVGSQVSGRVQEIFVDWNSPVKKGQLIARIDPQLFQAQAAQANANYVSAKAQLARAEVLAFDADRIYTRAKALAAQSLAGQAEVDTAETNAKVAKTQIDVAKATLEQMAAALNLAQVNLSYTKIISPIDGVVISRNVDVGKIVASSLNAPTLFTIAEDLAKMELRVDVDEADIGKVEVANPARFTVDAYPGRAFGATDHRGALRARGDRGRGHLQGDPRRRQRRPGAPPRHDRDRHDHGGRNRRRAPGAERGAALCAASGGRRRGRQRRRAYRPDHAAPAGAETPATATGRAVWVLRRRQPRGSARRDRGSDGRHTVVTGGEIAEGDAVVTDQTEAR